MILDKKSNTPLVYAGILGFFMGVCMRSFFELNIFYVLFATLLVLVVLLLMYIFSIHAFLPIIACIVIVASTLGFLRFDFVVDNEAKHILDSYLEGEITVIGVIAREPKRGENTTQLYIDTEDTGIVVFAEHYPVFSYGDKVRIRGIVHKPQSFETDTGRTFNYPLYLEKDGMHYQMFRPDIELLEGGKGSWVIGQLFSLKNLFVSQIENVLTEPHASLAGGITVGKDESLGDELEREFRRTGIIHIVVLSGYNIAIVAEFFMRVFAWMPFVGRSVLALVAIILFMLLTGATATIVRASIMAVLVIIARLTGRNTDMVRLLIIAGFFMVLHNPYILMFDPSFQLSFLATLGLIYIAPLLEHIFSFVPTRYGFRELAVATLATQIFVLPLLLYMTGELSVISFLVNVLVLPVIPIAMFGGLVIGVLGYISPFLAMPFGYVEYLLLEYVFKITHFFSELSFSTIFIRGFSAISMLGVYTLYIVMLVYIQQKKKTQPPLPK